MKIRKVLRQVTALVLAASMTLGMSGIAYAAETDPVKKETINYVSLGDSMANGYGFVGYKQNSNELSEYDFLNDIGVYGEGAYPLQFEEHLEELGYDVSHTKLATSAMLAEDLLYLLDGREEFDDGWDGYKDYVGNYTDEELKPYFQDAITNADIITMGIGNASFGAFMLDRVTSALGVFGAGLEDDEKINFEDAIEVLELDAEQYELVMEIYNTLTAKLVQDVPEDIATEFGLADIVDVVSYTAAAYVVNNKLVMDKIIEMNPDVEIILVGLLNTTYGMNIVDEEGNVLVPFGDVMDVAFDALNAYMAGLPAVKQAQGEWQEANFYYAEQPNPLFICQEFEELLANEWVSEDARLDGTTIRDRNIDAFNDSLAGIMGAPFAIAINGVVYADVEKALSADPNWSNLTSEQQQSKIKETAKQNGELPTTLYGENFEDFLPAITLKDVQNFEKNKPNWTSKNFNDLNNRKNLSIALYLGIESGVAKSTDTMAIPLEGLLTIATNIESAFDGFSTNLGSPYTVATEMGDYLVSNDVLKGMCKVYGLFKVGNGMSVHPTPEGHDNIAAAVIKAYDEKYTATDATIENLKVALGVAADLVAEYYDEAYAYAYDYAVENGYIAEAVAGLDAVKAELNKIDVNSIEASDAFKAELKEAIQNAVETIDELITLIKEADELDDATYQEVLNLLGKLEDNLTDVKDLLTVAGVDLGNAAWAKYLEVKPVIVANLKEAVEKGTEIILEKLGEAYDAFVDATVAAAKEYAPEVADYIYNWLYNNPETIIGFFNEYGDEMAEFVGEHYKEIFAVIGFLISEFGDDIVNYVMENPEEVLATLVDLYEKHGENAWALIKVYLDESGITDALSDPETIKAALAEIQKWLEEYGPIIAEGIYDYADEMGYIEDLENAIKDLQDEIEATLKDYVENVKPGIESAISQLEKELADLKAELKALEEELAAKKAELENALEELKAQLENADAELRAQLEAAIEKIEAEIAKIEAAINAIEAKIAEVEAAIKELKAELAEIQEKIEKLVEIAGELQDAIEELIAITKGEVDGNVADVIEKIQAALDKVSELVEEAEGLIGEINAAIDMAQKMAEDIIGSIDGLKEAIETVVENAKDALDQVSEDLEAAIEAKKDEIKAELKEALEGLKAELDSYVAELEEAVKDLINDAIAELEAKAEELLKEAAEALADFAESVKAELEAKVAEVVDAFNAAYIGATTADYTVSADSYYVSIGGSYVSGTGLDADFDEVSFGYRVAEALGLKDSQYSELGLDGLRAEDLRYILDEDYTADEYAKVVVEDVAAARAEYTKEIKKADLITVSVGNDNLTTFIAAQLQKVMAGEQPYEMDWSRYVGKDGVAYVEKALAEVEAYFADNGLGEAAEMLTLLVETYAYGYAGYAFNHAEAINAIRAINPDAQIIVLGMYNVMDELVINVEGTEIALGDYVNYFVELSNLRFTTYAMLTPNTIFVEIPDTTTFFDEVEFSLDNLIWAMYFDSTMLPNSAGHEYIKDQILGALNVTVDESGLLGDADDDGDVDVYDARLTLRYAVDDYEAVQLINLVNADFDCDGDVDVYDARAILQYVVNN